MNYEVKNIYKKTNGKTVRVSVPGSKSITARAMLISAISRGTSTLYNAQYSDAVSYTHLTLPTIGG